MEAKVTWHSRMTFTATADSGFKLPLDTDPSVGGDNDGFRPMELLAMGLAGCTAMDVISILNKKRQKVTDFEVQVRAEQSGEHPKVFTRGVIEYLVTGQDVDEAALVRSIELSATRYCPAQAMLGKTMALEMHYQIFEDEGEGKRRLVRRGEWAPSQEQLEV